MTSDTEPATTRPETTQPATSRSAPGLWWLGVGVILLALNLRPLVVAVGPMLGVIRADTGMSAAMAGLLTTLPVLCFGAFAPLAPRLSQRVGIEPALLVTMVMICGGAALRLAPPLGVLFAGTVLLGAGIAMANVLIPSVIKRDFAGRVGLMTGLYTTMLCLGPAAAAGITVPLGRATGLGWRPVIALWGLLAVLAIVVWLPQVRRHTRMRSAEATAVEHPVRGLWRDRVAWTVTCYMGLQSLTFYTLVAWLPTRLADAGMGPAAAGAVLSVSSLVSVVGAVGAPAVITRWPHPGALTVGGAVLYAVALVGLLVAPIGGAYLWAALLGIGQGLAISLAVLFIVRRSPDNRHTAQLSSMAQCFGYLLAAVGPFVLGAVHQLAGGWTLPLLLLTATLVPQALAGYGASRERHVGQQSRPEPNVD
ncbi:MAG TPA: MFS transporter [Pseudonocardia sp.]|jgi:CP family cyanate transporter-like MFS transporter